MEVLTPSSSLILTCSTSRLEYHAVNVFKHESNIGSFSLFAKCLECSDIYIPLVVLAMMHVYVYVRSRINAKVTCYI